MKVREAQFSDLPHMAKLFFQLGYPSTLADLEQRWQRQADVSDTHTFIAEDDKKVIGVLVLNFIAPLHALRRWALISALVVDESIRSKGAGAALLEHAEQEATRAACSHIELSSSESRTRAHQFYLRHGFIEIRKRFVKRYMT